MTVVDPKKKHGTKLFFAIIILFLIGMFVFTGHESMTEHYVASDINSLFYAFSSLLHGDVTGFFDGLVGGIPVVALFMVLFALLHYLFTGPLGKFFKRKALATTMALVIAAYGFVDHRIYNYLLSLNAYAVAALVFSTLVIMLWGFTDRSLKTTREELTKMLDVKDKSKKDIQDIHKLKTLLRKMEEEREN